MKVFILAVLIFCCSLPALAQKTKAKKDPAREKLSQQIILSQIASNACGCIDSISTNGQSAKSLSEKINRCIKEQASAYQMMSKLAAIDINDQKGSQVNIVLDENSNEYKKFYYELERYLVDSCPAVRRVVATEEEEGELSISQNPEARELYSTGIGYFNKEDYQNAVVWFEKAVAVDPKFAFAWDNIGVSYRQMKQYDQAIEAYKKSLEIDPKGKTPLQNLAVVYTFKKDYKSALATYEKMKAIYPDNAEADFGIGRIYTFFLPDMEKALNHMCSAYNLYVEQKSPYRTDAESVISRIYTEMKKNNQEDKFIKILKEHGISSE